MSSFSKLSALHLRHSSFLFTKLSVTSPTSQLILQPFPCFTYVTAHSPTFLLLHLHHSSFSNPSLALPMSQLILQPFHYFTYVTAHPPTFLSPLLHQRIFTYVTWRAAHGWDLCVMDECILKDDTDQVYAVHVYVHHLHTDRTHFHHLRQHSPVDSFMTPE